MSTVLAPFKDTLDFLTQFRAVVKVEIPFYLGDMETRRCVITRSPSYYGETYSAMIEWEGSGPQWLIYVAGLHSSNGPLALVVWGESISNIEQACEAKKLIKMFLAAHPANSDGSPVWIEPLKVDSNE